MSREILIIKPSSLGDIVHGMQAAVSLRQQLPDCRITWIVRDIFQGIVNSSGVADEVLLFRRKHGVPAFFTLSKEIRQKKYDWVLDFQGLLRSGLMTWVAQADRKIGRSDAREFATLFYGEKAPLPPAGKDSHAVDILLQFLPLLGLKAELRGSVPFATGGLEEMGPDADFRSLRPVVIVPNSRGPAKEWKGFPALTPLLLKARDDIAVVWDSHLRWEDPVGIDKSRFFNLTGKTTLDQMTALLNQAALVIANDSGPMHIAAAMGRPVIALFGPTLPERCGPYPLDEPRNQVIRAPQNQMSLLDVQTVLETACDMLDRY